MKTRRMTLMLVAGRCAMRQLYVAPIVLAFGGVCIADVIHVPEDVATIQGAIEIAQDGDEVAVAPGGIYREAIDFLGKAITVHSSDGGRDVTTIDASGLNASVVSCVSGEGPDTILEGLTLTGGQGPTGGGMANVDSSPTVINCIFSDSTASVGGGMYNKNSSPTVIGCTFVGNSSSIYGGGVYANLGSQPTFQNCTFDCNSSDQGGAVYVSGGGTSVTMTDCTFTGNTADDGGAIRFLNDSAAAVISGCYFEGNSAVRGGAVARGGPDVLLVDCVFVDNQAGNGGAVLTEGGPIVGCRFVGNHATVDAGAIETSQYCECVITNCSFFGNSGPRGGGVWVRHYATITGCVFSGNSATETGGGVSAYAATVFLNNCTFSSNTAVESGGGLYVKACNADLLNCVMWGDSAPFGPEIGVGFYSAHTVNITHCDVQYGEKSVGLTPGATLGWSPSNTEFDPLFVDADGPDNIAGTADDDLHLATGSPSIDTGDPSTVAKDEIDFDGDDRILFCRIDRGADESQLVGLDCNANGITDACDIESGESDDCNLDGVPDECGEDCNNNGLPDECDIFSGLASDCNGNGIPDQCDLDSGTSDDCNNNGVPDECDPDCNSNGMPDDCELDGGFADDCNANGIPDDCDIHPLISMSSGQLSPIHFDSPQLFVLPQSPRAHGDVRLSFSAVGDFNSSWENVRILINTTIISHVYVFADISCDRPVAPIADELVIPAAEFNDFLQDENIVIHMVPSDTVHANKCSESYITVTIEYVADIDANGDMIPDECRGDLNGDGVVDAADLAILLGDWGPCGECTYCLGDLDGDCVVGPIDLAILLSSWG